MIVDADYITVMAQLFGAYLMGWSLGYLIYFFKKLLGFI